MIWKMMMFEEFQDGCLVLGNLLYVNECFKLFLSLYVA